MVRRKQSFFRTAILFALTLALALPLGIGTADAALSDAYLEQHLFQLPEGDDYDRAEAERMMARIKQIDPQIIESMIMNGVRIRLFNGKLTDEPEMAYLRGVTPRGWEGTGITWDDVPGAGSQTVYARIGYSEPGNGHGSINLELHETFHAIDEFVFGNLSYTPQFEAVFNEEASGLFGGDGYNDTHPEEYFAEIAAMIYYSDDTHSQVQAYAPKTYKLIVDAITKHKPAPQPIPDLAKHWARSEMERLVSLNILSGYEDGSYRPNAQVTREQFAKLLAETTGIRTRAAASVSTFADVKPSSWSAPYIEALYAAGIADATPAADGGKPSFRPQDPITRLEMAVWTARALSLEPAVSRTAFGDAHLFGTNAELVGAAVNAGLLTGMPDGRFDPNGLLTRAQAAVLLNRMIDLPA